MQKHCVLSVTFLGGNMINFLVCFVHCGCSNLNLVVNTMPTSLVMRKNVFALIRDILDFFGSSTNRWRDLKLKAGKESVLLKKLRNTS